MIVGLTGGIGSGKTAVSDCFEELGIVIVDADLASRVVVEKGKPCLEAGLNLFEAVRWITTPSVRVRPCALFTVSAKPATTGNCFRVNLVPSLKATIGSTGTHVGSPE